ncbi:DNA primase, partial [Bacillus paralicheniformis]|nr:DNA primase [Bacillus paralicheniformis]
IIVQSPVEHVTIVTDNDKAGEKLRAEVERYLYGKVGLAHGYITEGKDANELLTAKGRAELKAVYERAEDVKGRRLKLPKRVSFSLTGDT